MFQESKGGLQFSVYYPQEVKSASQNRVSVYIFKATAASAVIQDAQELSSEDEPRELTEAERQQLREVPLVGVTLDGNGLQSNPLGRGSYFLSDWYRFDFELRVPSISANQLSTCVVTVDVDGVIVGDIPISFYVTEQPEGKIISTTRSPYQSIYCSYSYEDISIVERVERASELLKLDYFRKVIATRSRSKGSSELLTMIDQADIFQLFWSEAAAQANYVEKEWRYAYQLGRSRFIRPVYYWLNPMPAPPLELGDTSFFRRFGLWIELKYYNMPIEDLNLSEGSVKDLKRYGISTVSDIMEWFENSYANPSSTSARLIRHTDELRNTLESIGVRLPKNFQ